MVIVSTTTFKLLIQLSANNLIRCQMNQN